MGELVRRVAEKSLDEFALENIFRPLGMNETGFLPRSELRCRAAPTEKRDSKWIQGEVHDPRAHLLSGVAGHAGLFSTAEDLAIYAQMMIGGGEYGNVRILSPRTVAVVWNPRPGDPEVAIDAFTLKMTTACGLAVFTLFTLEDRRTSWIGQQPS